MVGTKVYLDSDRQNPILIEAHLTKNDSTDVFLRAFFSFCIQPFCYSNVKCNREYGTHNYLSYTKYDRIPAITPTIDKTPRSFGFPVFNTAIKHTQKIIKHNICNPLILYIFLI